MRYAHKNLHTQNLRTEPGVRTFVNSMPGSEGQYTSSCQNAVQIGQIVTEMPPSWISLDVKFVTDQTVTRAELRHRGKFS